VSRAFSGRTPFASSYNEFYMKSGDLREVMNDISGIHSVALTECVFVQDRNVYVNEIHSWKILL